MKKKIKILSFLLVIMMVSTLFVSCNKNEVKEINVLNYGENIAEGLLEEFEKEFGIKVNYRTFD